MQRLELSPASEWRPPPGWQRIQVIDAHTGGEPFRVVLSGLPEIEGDTVAERRSYAERHLDHLRRVLILEPRGHADMYGGWLGPPTRPDSDLSVLFLHNDGFSTMCGHGIIALAKVVVDTGVVERSEPETTVTIDTPAGQVVARASISGGRVHHVEFRNVASFVSALDSTVDVSGLGAVAYDLAFGGAFYAYVSAEEVGVDLEDIAGLVSAGRAIKAAVAASADISHPAEPTLGFLYGVVFVGNPSDQVHRHRSVCVFADGEVDRSPTGTGVSGSLAILHRRGEIEVGEPISVESIVGSVFTGRVVEETEAWGVPAVVPEISGSAHLIGRSEFWVDPDDPLGEGFLLR